MQENGSRSSWVKILSII